MPDRFDEAYSAGIVEEDVPATGDARGVGPPALAAGGGLALGGCILTQDGPLENGYVIVGPEGHVADVGPRRPEGVAVQETDGVILPGLIDLHGHPEWNVFAAWEPPQLFSNRYEWRASDAYRRLVRNPQNRLLEVLPPGTQARYAEIRALVGGVTAIQGASGRYPSKDEALVRNVDLYIFGQHRARAVIDLPGEEPEPDDLARLQSILGAIGSGEVQAFYVHLAEGRPDDERSAREFDRALELGALTSSTVVIHGTALGAEQFGVMKEIGANLVWSPQSNLRLYGETTRAADAIAVGVPVALGADWLPSGSSSLLAELKVARRALAGQGAAVSARQLVDMVTSVAAGVAGLEDHLGVLAGGRPADVLVLERHREDPWENVVEAEPGWVELVMIGGDLAYGRPDWMAQALGHERAGQLEPVLAWGKPMLLDTSYTARPTGARPPTLAQLRADLIAHHPQVGPIFA